jgi:hypothetical protein
VLRLEQDAQFAIRGHGVKAIDATIPRANGAGLEFIESQARALLELAGPE